MLGKRMKWLMLNYKISQWEREEKDVQIPPLREQVVYHFTCLVSVTDSDEHISLLSPEQVHLPNMPTVPQYFLPERRRLTLPSFPSGCAVQLWYQFFNHRDKQRGSMQMQANSVWHLYEDDKDKHWGLFWGWRMFTLLAQENREI